MEIAMKEEKVPNIWYLMMIFMAGMISVFDNVMNVVYMQTLPQEERNPLCSYLIGEFGVEGFVFLKAVSTILAVILMSALVYTRFRIVIVFVFIFQIFLLLYLNLYTPNGIKFFDKDILVPMESFFRFYLG
jgi:hypothetical protein